MPKVTIWIREGDWEIWETLKNRPEFLHQVLQLYKQKHSQEPTYTPEEPTA